MNLSPTRSTGEVMRLDFMGFNAQVNRQKCEAFLSALNLRLG